VRAGPDVKIPFGLYKGQALREAPTEYLRWSLRTIKDVWPWLRAAIKEELKRRAQGDNTQQYDREQRRLPTLNIAVVDEIVPFARRRLARMHHPDVHGGDGSHLARINATCDAILQWARSAA
jgi:hypothetical protein